MVERKFYRQVYQGEKRSRKKKLIFLFLKIAAFFIVFSAFAFSALFIYYAKDLPRPERFSERTFAQSTKIYDRKGEILLYELYGEERREIIPLSEMPENIKKAVISTEDANFYSHHGIDFRGILRAVLINLRIKKPLYGGSTISQQLIRSTFLTRAKTIKRKIREIILAIELERRYSKDQILEWYLNQVPFGPNIYGVEAASQAFFNKQAKELETAEAATLAALIKSPSRLSDPDQREELLIRRNYVLDRMAEENYLEEEEAEIAKSQELNLAEFLTSIKAPHFTIEVKSYLIENYGEDFLKEKGLKVYTTLDWELQQAAEEAVKKGAEANRGFKAYNAALVALDPKTGEILSMVGSADWFGESLPEGCTPGKNCFFDPKLNVATYRGGRQPGSAFKPFVYATAFSKGYDDKYVVIDEETNFGIWGGKPYIPHNYDGLFRGTVTLRQALAQSINVPAVKVLAGLAGLEDSLATARKCGITTLTQPSSFYGLAIVLGGGEVKLLDMASAYGVFAAEGQRIAPSYILKIEDSQGNIVEDNKKTPRRVLDEEAARMLNDVLSDNEARAPMFGYHSPLYFPGYQVAVKTGTTNSYRDAWTIGYTPSIAAGVWVGNNDNTAMAKKPGVMISSPIWHEFMAKALKKLPNEEFNPPIPHKKEGS